MTAAEPWLHRRSQGHAITAWYTQHIYLPTLRILVVIVFVAIAYPAIFGIDDAPTIWSLLTTGRGTNLMNVLMLLALALPLIPLAQRIPGVVLLAQGMTATSLLFSWLARDLGRTDLSAWPGFKIFVLTLLFSLLSFGLARLLIWLLHADERSNLALMAREGVRLYAALPAIALYGHALGQPLR